MTYDWIRHEPIEDYIHEIEELKSDIKNLKKELLKKTGELLEIQRSNKSKVKK